MSSPSSPTKREPISVRSARMNHMVVEKTASQSMTAKDLINRDSLFDVLFVLYEELNNDKMRRDTNVQQFLDRYRIPMAELKALRVGIQDFEVKKIIGRGHFGEVKVVKEKATGEVFAMKTLRKSETLSQKNVAFYEEERDIMAHPHNTQWITQLHYAFQDTDNLYLVMEFLPGGDLLSLLDRNDNVLNEDHAKFYLAELVQAINTLHLMGYVHRDIKPDNILIDRSGHIKLADFGSAARLTSRKDVTSKMPVGTPDYIAPEVLQAMNDRGGPNQTYGTCCDWWSLGIVAYEMLYGQTPFSDEKVMKTYSNIMNFNKTLTFSTEYIVSPSAIALIKELLEQADKRLDYKGLVEHKFFEGTFWTNIRQLVPPFVPQLTGLDDTSNFDDFDEAESRNSRLYLKSLQKKEFETKDLPFVGFTHTMQSSQQTMSTSMTASIEGQGAFGTLRNDNRRKELQEKLAKVQASESQLKDENEVLKTRLRECESRNAKFQEELSTVELQVIGLSSELKKMEEKYSVEVASRKKSEQKAVDIVKGYQKQYKRTDELIKWSLTSPDSPLSDNNKAKLDDIPGQILEQQDTIEQLTKELQKTRVVARDYKEKFHTMVSDSQKCLERLQEVQTGNLAYVEGLKRELGEAVTAKREVENNLTNAKKLCEQYVNRLKEMQDTNRELKVKVRTLETRVQELEDELGRNEEDGAPCDLKVECTELRARLQAAQETNSRLEVQVVELAQQVSQLDVDQSDSNSNLKCQSCVLMETERVELESLRSQVSALIGTTCSSCNTSLSNGRDSVDDHDSSVKKIRFSDVAEYTVNLGDGDTNQNFVAITDDEKRLSMATNTSYHTAASCLCNCSEENEVLKEQMEKVKEDVEVNKRRWLDTSVELRKRTDELKETQLDLRIARRELKNLEGSVNKTWETQSTIREKMADAHQRLNEKDKTECDLRSKITDLVEELNKLRDSERHNEMKFETEKAKLEERVKMLQDTTSTQSDLKEQLGSFSDQVKELSLKCKMLEKDAEIANKRKAETCHLLEGVRKELKEERSENGHWKEEFQSLGELMTGLNEEAEQNKAEIVALREQAAKHKKEKSSVESLNSDFSKVKEKLAERESDVMDLKDELRDMATKWKSSQETNERLNAELSHSQADLKCKIRMMENLGEELTSLKREASRHITTINTLNRNMIQLNEQLQDVNIRVEEEEERNRCMVAQMEKIQRENELQVLKLSGHVQQYSKVVDLLKDQLAKSSKKTGLFGFVSNKSSKTGPEMAHREAQNTSKLRKLQQELDSSRQEVMVLRSMLDKRRDNPNSSEIDRSTSASSSMSDCSAPPHESSPVNLASPSQRKVAEELTKSPASNMALQVGGGAGSGHQMLNRISHNIPHKFHTSLAYVNRKCDLCSRSISISSKVSVCQECDASFHQNCSLKAPSVCGLPREFLREYETLKLKQDVKFSKDTKNASFNADRPEGYVKIPKNGSPKFGWEKAYLMLDDGVLYLFDKSFTPGGAKIEAVDRYNLVGDGNTHMYIDRDVLKTEFREGVNTDYVLKLVVHNQEQDKKPLYMMFSSVAEKKLWHDSLQDTIEKYSKGSKTVTRKVAEIRETPMYCVFEYDDGHLLAGGAEGLNVVDVKLKKVKRSIGGIPAVFQIQLIDIFNMAVMIVDTRKHELVWSRLSDLRDWIQCEEDIDLPPVNLLKVGGRGHQSGIENCSMFRVSRDGSMLVVSNTQALIVLRYRAETLQYDVERRFDTDGMCSSIQLSHSSIIFSCDKVYSMDLRTFQVREFLDGADESLGFFPTAFKGPYYILEVEAHNEYLLACSAIGFFVNSQGRRNRVGDITLTGSILNLEMCQRSLFVCDDDHIQVCTVMPKGSHNDLRLVETLHAKSIRYLGRARHSDAIYVAWTWKNVRCISKIFASPVDNTSLSDLSVAGGEFSFTSSIEENLERYEVPDY